MLDFSFWEQASKKGFEFDLQEGEILEIARADKNQAKKEVYKLRLKYLQN